MEQLGSRWTDSYNVDISLLSENLSRKVKFSTFGQEYPFLYMKTNIHFDTSRSVLLRIRNVPDKIRRRHRNTLYVPQLFSKIMTFKRQCGKIL